jgi:hypothetical protein
VASLEEYEKTLFKVEHWEIKRAWFRFRTFGCAPVEGGKGAEPDGGFEPDATLGIGLESGWVLCHQQDD